MTRQELFDEKQYLDKYDIAEISDCGRDRAIAIIRSIKSVSDTCRLKGKVTLNDFERWKNR